MSIEARFNITKDDFTLDVNMNIPSSGVTALFGPSGCGKTSLLRLIAGLDYDPNGYLSVSGEVWQDGETITPTHQRAIGYVFQEANLFSHLNVQRNMEYGLKRIPPKDRKVSFDEASELLGLNGLLDRKPSGLSGGERQRVAIARTLLTSPRLLLMDEPLAALDDTSKAEIIPYLERLHAELKIPLLYVSHAFEEVARLADHFVLMKAGRVQTAGPFVEMMNRLDSPFAHTRDAESIIEAKVARHDDTYHLTLLDFDGGQISATRAALPIGHRVRVRVMARDVSLTLNHATETSILNIFPAKVIAMTDDNPSQITVRLDIGNNVPLLSRITRKSARALDIEVGKQVFAQVKSVALLGPYKQAGV